MGNSVLNVLLSTGYQSFIKEHFSFLFDRSTKSTRNHDFTSYVPGDLHFAYFVGKPRFW